MVLDDRRGWQYWRIHCRMGVRDKQRVKAHVGCGAAGRVDAVLGFHARYDELANVGGGEPLRERGAGKAVGAALFEHGVDRRIDPKRRKQLRERTARLDGRAGRADVACGENWRPSVASVGDQPADIGENARRVMWLVGAIEQPFLHIDDEEGAAFAREAGHRGSPVVVPATYGETTRPRPLLAGPCDRYDI